MIYSIAVVSGLINALTKVVEVVLKFFRLLL